MEVRPQCWSCPPPLAHFPWSLVGVFWVLVNFGAVSFGSVHENLSPSLPDWLPPGSCNGWGDWKLRFWKPEPGAQSFLVLCGQEACGDLLGHSVGGPCRQFGVHEGFWDLELGVRGCCLLLGEQELAKEEATLSQRLWPCPSAGEPLPRPLPWMETLFSVFFLDGLEQGQVGWEGKRG